MPREDPLEILMQDDRVVAVAKPYGLATIPGRGETDSVLERLARELGLPHTGQTDPRLRLVHRLDKDTSGVLLFAKDVDAQRHVSHQFQNNTVHKEYLALVHGRPREQEGEVDAALGVDPYNKRKMAVLRFGRAARTRWRVEQAYRHAALLRVFPKTGKTHQIRVHLKHIGHPLLVDPLYNPPKPGEPIGVFVSSYKRGYRPTRGDEERPLIDRLTLHAEKLRFVHPDGRETEVAFEPPKDLRATINSLGKFARA